MDWKKLKEQIYFWDGSWRDIYVLNTSVEDWRKWCDFINSNYKVSWYNGKFGETEQRIDFSVIQEYWNGNHDLTSSANVYIDHIQVNAHFFDDKEIENDIDPREFNTIEDHDRLISYLIGLSTLLEKQVIVTPENCPEIILIEVMGTNVRINTGSNRDEWPLRIKK